LTKALVHEKILQGEKDFRLLRPNDADYTVDQHFFINRKIDRFTISGRYFARGKNSLGKNWSKWRTSFTLSFTLKQPKESKETRLNIFVTGKGFGHFPSTSLGVRNITRQPEVYLISLPDIFKQVVVEELEDLYKRVGEEYSPAVTMENFAENIKDLAYPSNQILSEASVPLFAGELLRAKTRSDVSKFLFSKDKNIRKQFADATFKLSTETLGYALLTKNIIPDAERYSFIAGQQTPTEHSLSNNKTLFEPGLSYDSLITFTRFLKKLTLENRRLVINSEAPYGIVTAIAKWNSIKDITQGIDYESITSWNDAISAISNLNSSFKEENSSDCDTEELMELIKSIFEDSDFVKIESTDYSESIKLTVGTGYFHFSHHMFWNPRSKSFYLGMNWTVVKNNSLVYNTIQNDPYTPYRKQNVKTRNINDQNVAISAKAAYYLFSYLSEKAEENLAKYHVEVNKESIAKYIFLELLLNSEYKLRNIGSKVPTAFYRMLKMDIDMENILFFLQRKIAISTAASLDGMPKNWILKALSLPEEDPHEF
jgi:hypothetical protein